MGDHLLVLFSNGLVIFVGLRLDGLAGHEGAIVAPFLYVYYLLLNQVDVLLSFYNMRNMKAVSEKPFAVPSKNHGTATFSSLAKQAEQLVHGEHSIIFDSYNNAVIFRSARLNQNLCISLDILNRMIANVVQLKFADGTIISGISDGYSIDSKGGMVPIYDSTIALSTAFGYELSQSSESIRKDLNVEIERRIQDSERLLNEFQQTSQDCEEAIRLVHYLAFDTENHAIAIVVPYENPEGNLGYGDLMPAETLFMEGESYYDPNTGINQVEPVGVSEKNVAVVDVNGLYVDGAIVCTGHYEFPGFEVEGEEETISIPPGIIYGVTPTMSLPMDELLPTSLAVASAMNEQTEAFLDLLEALRVSVEADLQNHAALIAYAQSWIDGLINSSGGWEKKDLDPLEEEWFNHPIWLYIKRWIQLGIYDNLYGYNQTDKRYWGDCQASNELMRYFAKLKEDYCWEKSGALALSCTTEISRIGATTKLYNHIFSPEGEGRIEAITITNPGYNQAGFFAKEMAGMSTDLWLYVGKKTQGLPDFQHGYNLYVAGTASIAGVDIGALNNRVQELEQKVAQYEDQSAKIAALEQKVARLEKLLEHFVSV